jgi:GNAT superfamily N-acetyltransferase
VAARATIGSTGRGGETGSARSSSQAPAIKITRVTESELPVASSVLTEAARWLIDRGEPLWEPADLVPERLRGGIADGSLHLVRQAGEPVGTIALQWEDPTFWPDAAPGESAFVHRLAVRRSVAGTGVAGAMLTWAQECAASAGCRWLRLDCSARHERLCAYYRDAGFQPCGTREIGSYVGQLFERSVSGVAVRAEPARA